MPTTTEPRFAAINRAFADTFRPGRLSLGLTVPIESYPDGPVPTMADHVDRVRLAEELGFAAVWLRDVPFNVPSFGDAGQPYDPFVYLGLLAGATERIALGVASIILPLRHPAHVAKAAATADVLSDGRLLLGVASGDRPDEYPAMNLPFDSRAERFRDSYQYIRRMADDRPSFESPLGSPGWGMDLIPKPTGGRLPMLITGSSRQPPAWVAANGDGWITYPRPLPMQSQIIDGWRADVAAAGLTPKPVMQPLYVDLADNPTAPATPIHLGFHLGIETLTEHVQSLQRIGVNHVAINLRFNRGDTATTMTRLAEALLPGLDPEGSDRP
ncbi:MAG: LLM class oxidoreductase [Actinomycetota bacterium]